MRAFGVFQHEDVIAGDLRVQRSAEFFPVREQFVQGPWFEHRAGKDMGTDFGTFLHDADADFLTRFSRFLFQPASGGQACGAGTDDDHVEFHVFAFHRLSPTLKAQQFSSDWRFGAPLQKGRHLSL